MNRAERRNVQREKAKLSKAVDRLTPQQAEMVDIRAKELATEILDGFTGCLDSSITAAIISQGGTLETAEKFTGIVSQYLNEESEKKGEFKRKCKNEEEYKMAMKKVSEDVIKSIKEVFDKKITKKAGIDELCFEYPALSRSMITNAYEKVKQEMKPVEEVKKTEDPEITAALKYIFSEEEEKKVEKKVEKIIEAAKEAQCEKKIEKVVEKVENKLKVKMMVLEGDNGLYTVCDNGIELKNDGLLMLFEDREQLDAFYTEYKQVFAMRN